ncbi:hypothetical protein [Streptomyces sp. NPDC047981]|uniref:hypothetical protein n=1 Tax=Streptomyces sp. NPDC047981 TaxID=3154610 RepID=UPI00342A5106
MSEWGIALIAAGSAILGSITTGFFTWKAGHRQAAATVAAGQAQAAALIATVQATLDEQRRARAVERRRQVYVHLLEVGQAWQVQVDPEQAAKFLNAQAMVELEGPPEVAEAALRFAVAVNGRYATREEGVAPIVKARKYYMAAVRRALDET